METGTASAELAGAGAAAARLRETRMAEDRAMNGFIVDGWRCPMLEYSINQVEILILIVELDCLLMYGDILWMRLYILELGTNITSGNPGVLLFQVIWKHDCIRRKSQTLSGYQAIPRSADQLAATVDDRKRHLGSLELEKPPMRAKNAGSGREPRTLRHRKTRLLTGEGIYGG